MHRSWFCTHFVSGWCVYLGTCDLQVYCFLFPKGLCFMLKNMCSETKPAGSRSTTVMSSFLLLGRQVARGLLRKKAGGFYFLCVCAHIVVKIYITYIQPQYCTSLFHLPTRHCGVSDVRLDYLWGNNGAVKVAEINEAFFFFALAGRLRWLASTAAHVASAWCCRAQGYPTLSYTQPDLKSLRPVWL